MEIKVLRVKSKVKILARELGGKWKYDNICGWHCDDGIRSVYRRSAGVDEWDNEVGPPQYWLYGNEAPRLIWWKTNGMELL
jgi:hypothetical protein